MEQSSLTITPYTDNSFKLSGELTRNFANELKQFNGRYNPHLRDGPGWIFSNKQLEKLSTFIEQVNSGEIVPPEVTNTYRKPSPPIRSATTTTTTRPVAVPQPAQPLIKDGMEYQTVTYTLVKPKVGMNVNIKIGSSMHKSSVLNVYEHYGYVDEIDITPINDLITLVICNGQWSLKGFADPHQVSFTKE